MLNFWHSMHINLCSDYVLCLDCSCLLHCPASHTPITLAPTHPLKCSSGIAFSRKTLPLTLARWGDLCYAHMIPCTDLIPKCVTINCWCVWISHHVSLILATPQGLEENSPLVTEVWPHRWMTEDREGWLVTWASFSLPSPIPWKSNSPMEVMKSKGGQCEARRPGTRPLGAGIHEAM